MKLFLIFFSMRVESQGRQSGACGKRPQSGSETTKWSLRVEPLGRPDDRVGRATEWAATERPSVQCSGLLCTLTLIVC